MVDEHSPNPGHDETIVPVKPGLKGLQPVVSKVDSEKAISTPTLVGSLGALVVLVVVVFFVLPGWVEKQENDAITEITRPPRSFNSISSVWCFVITRRYINPGAVTSREHIASVLGRKQNLVI